MKKKKENKKTLMSKLRSLKGAFGVNDHFQHFKPSNEKLQLSEPWRGLERLSGVGQHNTGASQRRDGTCLCLPTPLVASLVTHRRTGSQGSFSLLDPQGQGGNGSDGSNSFGGCVLRG